MSLVYAALIEGKYGNEAVNDDPQSLDIGVCSRGGGCC
jgi:hypothetical protein